MKQCVIHDCDKLFTSQKIQYFDDRNVSKNPSDIVWINIFKWINEKLS